MYNEDLSKSKIININDFIFRQNLEFYPNLQGLIVEDNILKYKENGNTIASESLTFDLRTLPGEVWNYNRKEFLETIKINKSCKHLISFINLLNQNAFDNITLNEEELKNQITNYMNLYFSIKDSFNALTEENKILISNVDNLITTLPKETIVGSLVNKKLDEYFEMTKTIGDEKGTTMALVLKNKNQPSLIEEDVPTYYPKAGYINIAILIYGIINIGIILAIAFMK